MMSIVRTHVSFAFVLISLAAAMSVGCVEDGAVPQCPGYDEAVGGDGNFDETVWRKKAEAAGCVTPIGGSNHGGASSSK